MVRKAKETKPVRGSKPGRKTVFKEETNERAYRLSLLGLNDQQIGIALGVSVQTIENWKRTKREFRLAIQRGKLEADSKVANALYEKACGYSHPDTHITSVFDKRTGTTEIIKTPITKHYPPDTQAAIFWLTNRQRDHWQYTTKMEHSGKVKLEHADIPTDLSDLTDDELNALKKMVGIDKLLNIKQPQMQ